VLARSARHKLAAGGELRRTLLRLKEASPALSSLTAREMQYLRLCAEGKSYWESGVILGISQRTVSYHMEAVRSKLGAATNAHAVALICTSLVGT
jgi:DNA-binding CsgD family transcriptional regulator